MVPYPLLIERLMDVVGYTPINNISGDPAMSVPLHWTRGDLPVGAHFAAKIGDERTLLELAYQLEAAKPWAGRRPAVHA
jgi:amidase